MDENRLLNVNRNLALAIKGSRQFACGEFTVDLQIAHYTSDIGGFSTGLHHHEYYELATAVDGKMEYSDGDGCGFSRILKSKRPGWILIPSKLVHSRRVVSEKSTVLGIMFRVSAAKGAMLLRFNQILREREYLLENGESFKWLKMLDSELDRASSLRSKFLCNIIELTVIELFRASFQELFSLEEEISQQKLLPEMVSAHIDEHLNNEISLDSLAVRYHLSPRHLNRLFTAHFGVSPGQYLIRQRLKLCAHQLLNTDKQIKEIASDCGFKHQGYFIRQFLKHFNVRPSDYRKHG